MPDIDARIQEFIDGKSAVSPNRESFLSRGSRWASQIAIRAITALASLAIRCSERLAATCDAVNGRKAIRQEIGDHLRDAYDRQIEQGRSPDDAWQHATQHFGDYEAVLGELESLHGVPIWEWLTRCVALVIGLCILQWFGPRVSTMLSASIGAILLVAAPLAASDFRESRIWLRWLMRASPLFIVAIGFHQMGLAWQHIMIIVAVMTIAGAIGFPSARFATRLRGYMLLAMFCGLYFGLLHILKDTTDLNRLGLGAMVLTLFPLYVLLFGRPGWLSLLAIVICCNYLMLLVQQNCLLPVSFARPPDWTILRIPMMYIMLATIAGWAFYGRRPYTCWFPAVSVMAMILIDIRQMCDLSSQPSLQEMMLRANLPLFLWLVPAFPAIKRGFSLPSFRGRG